MEARFLSAALIAASTLSLGASHRTQNFIVTTARPELAREIGEAAERYRRELAIQWLGRELPPWREPCPITAQVAPHLGAGGATSFMFDRGTPFGWRMNIQGSHARLLDSVLPHEVTHMIFATHFGRPLPRWADEGACTTVEHPSEKAKQQRMLYTFLTTGRGIAFNTMFAMREYPRDILPLYSQGYALARFLIAQGGRQEFVKFVGDGMNSNNWTAATKNHYGFASLSELQIKWLDWVRRGCPPIDQKTTLVADAGQPPKPQAVDPLPPVRGSGSDGAQVALVGQAGSTVGWYARQRDAFRSGSAQSSSAEDRSSDGHSGGSPTDIDAAPSPYGSLTRPQPIGKPRPAALQPIRATSRSVAAPPMVPLPAVLPQHGSG